MVIMALLQSTAVHIGVGGGVVYGFVQVAKEGEVAAS